MMSQITNEGSTMLLGQAVAETTGLYVLVIGLILLYANPLIGRL